MVFLLRWSISHFSGGALPLPQSSPAASDDLIRVKHINDVKTHLLLNFIESWLQKQKQFHQALLKQRLLTVRAPAELPERTALSEAQQAGPPPHRYGLHEENFSVWRFQWQDVV